MSSFDLDPRLIATLCFLAVTAVIVAAWMLVRDLVRPVRPSTTGALLRRRAHVPSATAEEHGIASLDQRFEQLVTESGLPLDPMSAVLLLVAVGLALAAPAFLWTDNPLPAGVFMLLGMGFTLMFFSYRRRRRLAQIEEQLPDVVDLVARTVRAGGSLDQAVSSVSQKIEGPLAVELQQCARQLDMGLSLPAAFRSLDRRIRLMDVQMFVTTLAVHRETGGGLAETLERMAAVMRDRLNFRRQIRATTAAGRLSATLIAMTGPLLFIYFFLFKQDYIRVMMDEPLGQVLLGSAILLEIVGVTWIMALVRPRA